MAYLAHKKILEISINAKIDRLELLYIDLTLVLKRLVKNRESVQKYANKESIIFHKGIEKGYIECLEEIERNIKVLSESKV